MIRFTQAVFWPTTAILIGTSISIFLFTNRLIVQFDPSYNIDETRLLIEKILQNKIDIEEEIKTLTKEHKTLSELVLNPSDRKNLNSLKRELNLTEINGEGVLIELSVTHNNKDNRAICVAPHLRDIRNILNLDELQVKGISINEYRLGYNSVINCMGNGLIIDYTRIIPSLEIKVIGDANKIINILSTKKHLPSLWSDIENGTLKFNIQKREILSLHPFTGNTRTEYIQLDK